MHKFTRPLTAGTSLSEAAVGRPSPLQAAHCHPSLSQAGTEHRHATSRHPAPAPSTGTQHQAPPPGTQHPATARQHGHPAPCLHHAHSQLAAPAPAPAPCLHHVHIQLTAPAPSTSTSNLSPPHAQPAHSASTQPAHSTSSSTGARHHHVHIQLTAPAPAPAPGTSTTNLSPAPPPGTQHQQPVSKARAGNSLLFEVRTP